MSDRFQIPVHNVRKAVPTIIKGDSHRHSVVLDRYTVESVPCALPAARDTHRDTIGRDEFLQLRLPLVGLLDANEIEDILDAVRGDGDAAVGRTPVVNDLITTSPAIGQHTNPPITPTTSTLIYNTLHRRPRTSRSATRCGPVELPELGVVSEEEGEVGNEVGVKPARKSSWRRGFKAVFRRGSGRI